MSPNVLQLPRLPKSLRVQMRTTMNYPKAIVQPGLLLVLAGLLTLPAPAQEKSVRPGINKSFDNPNVKEYVEKFEGESREIAKHAKEIIAACAIKPGMAIADVGAGTGFFTRKFALEAGPKGK